MGDAGRRQLTLLLSLFGSVVFRDVPAAADFLEKTRQTGE
jgi:hypothetical protein